jgi:hypothetical protein
MITADISFFLYQLLNNHIIVIFFTLITCNIYIIVLGGLLRHYNNLYNTCTKHSILIPENKANCTDKYGNMLTSTLYGIQENENENNERLKTKKQQSQEPKIIPLFGSSKYTIAQSIIFF